MHLKTTNNLIVEKAYFTDNSSLLLTGCEGVCSDIKKYQNFDPQFTCGCNEFASAFKEEDKFFYRLEHYNANDLIHTEVGIGHLKGKLLNRLSSYFSIQKGEVIRSPSFYDIVLSDSDYIHVSNYVITNALELMIDKNVIPYTNDEVLFSSLHVDKNSVIGRGDKDIQSIPFSTFISPSHIISLLSSFTNSISLKARKLYCKTLNCSSLVVSLSSKARKPPKGTLIVDKEDNKLKLFDGNNWNILVTQKD